MPSEFRGSVCGPLLGNFSLIFWPKIKWTFFLADHICYTLYNYGSSQRIIDDRLRALLTPSAQPSIKFQTWKETVDFSHTLSDIPHSWWHPTLSVTFHTLTKKDNLDEDISFTIIQGDNADDIGTAVLDKG